jgi:hypothetical protein
MRDAGFQTTVTVEVQSAQTATKGTASHCENRRLLADAPQTKRDRGATRPLHPELRTSRSREKARVNTTCVLRGEDDGWIFPTTYPTGGGASGRIGGGTLYAGNIWALGGFSKSMVSSHSHYNAVRTLPHEEYHRTGWLNHPRRLEYDCSCALLPAVPCGPTTRPTTPHACPPDAACRIGFDEVRGSPSGPALRYTSELTES